MSQDWLKRFIAEQQLPPTFVETVDVVCCHLAEHARAMAAAHGTAIVGLCGPQGSGKSTIAEVVVGLLEGRGLKAVSISLDDFYLPRETRRWLALEEHPLLAVRGPPGTHDIELARETLERLTRSGPLVLPAFDKARDTRVPREALRTVQGPVDVVILEGWFVGANPQLQEALAEPVNDLEREADPDGAWRGYVNALLAGLYQDLWRWLHGLVFLQAPGFEVVTGWRIEQEAKLRARTGLGMSDTEVVRFVAHYERLTRWMLDEMPAHADWVVQLDSARRPVGRLLGKK